MNAVTKLYTPQVLALATALADYPLNSAHPLQGNARSAVCGSAIAMSLEFDGDGRITSLGMKVHACAIGQAAASLFAQSALGRTRQKIASAGQEIEKWLQGEAANQPDWPGIEVLAPAREYPGRYGAILLPWKAALATLP